ncbi:flagellar motor switch phosphatase FliY [Candidatus Arthromitus sp. SFB-rat-Yit]|uniref:flagellar motor switch phosphatase FliY n=1 Tax=Candidatus Arthromitus sp. SFB-rat-Yit TaxID=1041504 RepID=UPI000227A5D3|nr:flagellar motor switch phosphatase FliY [Candidatus Arthromitus sp. SFB-rat-Yit]BAK81037.1 flagellar motor switch protein [Candidatus Arthromitus sp. SFB-rat-Yit]
MEKENQSQNDVSQLENSTDPILTSEERDLLGEIGNICMGNASTSFSKLLQKPVTITTPTVEVVNISDIAKEFMQPHIALKVKYTKGIDGNNVLVMSIRDAIIIADLMMGGDGKNVEERKMLNEIEISAVSEAMNQMIASSATSMSTMFQKSIDISTPETVISYTPEDSDKFFGDGNEKIIKIKFQMNVTDLINSNIVQVLSLETGKNIINIMLNDQNGFKEGSTDHRYDDQSLDNQNLKAVENSSYTKPIKDYDVSDAVLMPLSQGATPANPNNIDLILDVPLEISVVLGKTKKNVGEILNLGTGSLVELEKLAEEPVDILVNGKQIATGEVVVVNENFGVRITAILSNTERVKNLNL